MKDRCRSRGLYGAAVALLVHGFAACGSSPADVSDVPPDEPPDEPPTSGNAPPTIAAIDDRTVIRNTITPRTADVVLHIQDPDDDSFTVTVTPADESVIPAATLTCGLDPCLLSLTPSPDRTARVSIQVQVSDGRGGLSETSFVVDVVPRLVTNPSDSDPGSLRDTVLSADRGDVIGFDTDGVFSVPRIINVSSPIELDRDLTIEGPGAADLAVSGGDAVRVLEITTSSIVALSGLTVADGRAEQGGGILVGNGSILALGTSVVTGSTATQAGGGIHNVGTLVLREESHVSGNEAPAGGGIHNAGTVEIAGDSQIAGNSANDGGGILNASDGDVTIGAATIRGNVAENHGGGIANSGTLTIDESGSILGNEAGSGAGIYNAATGQTTISGGTIGGSSPQDANTAAEDGGAIFNGGNLQLGPGSVAAGNEATRGGGIFNDAGGTATITEAAVRGNRTEGDGGGIYNSGDLTITGGTVGNNRTLDASGRGAGIYNLGRLRILENSSVSNNDGSSLGGGVANEGHTFVSNSTVRDNVGSRGGGVGNNGTLIVIQSIIAGNGARGFGLNNGGGGILNLGDGDVTVSNSTVGGSAPEDANTSREHGGGIRNLGRLRIMAGSHISGNRADFSGGGISNETFFDVIGETTIVASSVMHNTAQLGGGILNGGVLSVEALGHIDNNTAELDGGGIYSHATSEIVIDNSSVVANQANRNGGGLHVHEGVITVTGTSCLIVANVANANGDGEGTGGGIYNAGGDISGVPSGRVCFNQPNDFAP